jgi:hypothetical protein
MPEAKLIEIKVVLYLVPWEEASHDKVTFTY